MSLEKPQPETEDIWIFGNGLDLQFISNKNLDKLYRDKFNKENHGIIVFSNGNINWENSFNRFVEVIERNDFFLGGETSTAVLSGIRKIDYEIASKFAEYFSQNNNIEEFLENDFEKIMKWEESNENTEEGIPGCESLLVVNNDIELPSTELNRKVLLSVQKESISWAIERQNGECKPNIIGKERLKYFFVLFLMHIVKDMEFLSRNISEKDKKNIMMEIYSERENKNSPKLYTLNYTTIFLRIFKDKLPHLHSRLHQKPSDVRWFDQFYLHGWLKVNTLVSYGADLQEIKKNSDDVKILSNEKTYQILNSHFERNVKNQHNLFLVGISFENDEKLKNLIISKKSKLKTVTYYFFKKEDNENFNDIKKILQDAGVVVLEKNIKNVWNNK